jgi:tryptophanyl-tRNA synthetase
MAEKKILVSGVKPTGKLHIGNYFGALKQFVDLQSEYNSYIFVADLHALTSQQNASELNTDIRNIVLDYLAIGLDPKNITLYKQSDIPEVTELSWIFSCLTTMPYLQRAHAYKDAEARNKELNVGVFNYPLLMAADILLPGADVVPVGKDQRQHIEIARDCADKFNRAFGETFKLPKELIIENRQVVPGTDGQKMSKSYGNTIELFAEDEDIKKSVMSIVTDSKTPDEPKDPETDNVFALHKLFTEGPEFEDVRDRYEAGKIGYKESKDILVKNITAFISPLRIRRIKLAEDKDLVKNILEEGKNKIKPIIEQKMNEVRDRVGLTIK